MAGFVLGAVLMGVGVRVPAQARSKPPRIVPGKGTQAPKLVARIKAPASSGPPATVALRHIDQRPGLYGIDDPSNELEVKRVTRDEGDASVRFAQQVDGVPVFGADYVVHLDRRKEGFAPTSVTGTFFTELQAPREAAFSETVAADLARRLARPITIRRLDRHGLVMLPTGDGVLAYHFTAWGTVLGRTAKRELFVNARTGALALSYNNLQFESVDGVGVNARDQVVNLNVFRQGDTYELRDETHVDSGGAPIVITTHDVGSSDSYFATDENLVRSQGPVFADQASDSGAVDGHWGITQTIEYFQALGWDSVDDNGMPIKVAVNASDPLTGGPMYNAFWDGTQIVFGNPDPNELYPFSAALDVVAHELVHGITQHTGNLVYLSQPGAINEAVSDYFGEAVEVEVRNLDMSSDEVGQIGEDICRDDTPRNWVCPLRDIDSARGTGDYFHYLTDFDNGGVHDNATIFGSALWEIRKKLGGQRADYYVFTALRDYFTPLMDFYDARLALEAAVIDKPLEPVPGSEQSDLQVVQAAFQARGITEEWESGQASDADVLVRDISPTGSLYSAPRATARRFVTAGYTDATEACCETTKLFVGSVKNPGATLQTVGDDDDSSTYNDETPDISGRRVVWAHSTLTSSSGFDVDVRTRVLGHRAKTVKGGRGFQWFPAVDGKRVAWEDTRNGGQTDIYTRTVGGKTKRVTRTGRKEEWLPDVSGRWVSFWVGGNTGSPKIMARNIKSGRRIVIKPPRAASLLGPPSLGPSHMYWWQDVDGDGTGEIARVKLKRNPKVRKVVRESSDFAPEWLGVAGAPVPPIPSANADFVAYVDESDYITGFVEGRSIDSSEVGRNVYVVSASGGSPRSVTQNRGDQAYPAIAGGDQVVWLDGSLGRTSLMTKLE